MAYLKVSASISRLQTMADGTLRLIVDCQEADSETDAALLSLRRELLWLLFVRQGATEEPEQPPAAPKKEKGQKTPSQEMREAIWRQWKKRPHLAQAQEWEDYYRDYMSELIRQVNEAL
jgi:hypothetical protein